MKLYYAPQTISVTIAIALEEAGLDYDTVPLNFADGDQAKPGYAAINTKGRVPALDIGSAILTETGALLEYIADIAPNAGLRPSDPLDLARMREVMFYLASTMHVNHAHKLRGHRWADQDSSHQDMRAKVPDTMAASCAYISDTALRGPFVLGDSLSLADLYLYVICTWLDGDGVDVNDFPRLQAFMTTMETRASVRTVRARGML